MESDEAPAWLTEDSSEAPSTNFDNQEQTSLNNSNSTKRKEVPEDVNAGLSMLKASGHAEPPKPKADESEPTRTLLFMRILNMLAAVLLIAVSILVMVGIPRSLSMWVLAIYASCGGCLVVLHETQLKFFRKMLSTNFGFLFSSLWRLVYYVMLGSIAYQYEILFGYIVAGIFGGTALYNTYVLCRYPSFQAIREKYAQKSDPDNS